MHGFAKLATIQTKPAHGAGGEGGKLVKCAGAGERGAGRGTEGTGDDAV
jgi:hypothetical protein